MCGFFLLLFFNFFFPKLQRISPLLSRLKARNCIWRKKQGNLLLKLEFWLNYVECTLLKR